MRLIPIVSCPSCSPDDWKVTGKSKFGKIYKCQKCKEVTNLLLKRRTNDKETNQTMDN